MLRIYDDKQIRMEFVNTEELVPHDHLLRKIEREENDDQKGFWRAFLTPPHYAGRS